MCTFTIIMTEIIHDTGLSICRMIKVALPPRFPTVLQLISKVAIASDFSYLIGDRVWVGLCGRV